MNLPNKLTVMRLCLIPVFVATYIIDFPFHVFVALGIFIVACLTDFLDGHIARKYNLVTDLGKFLDPIADKVLVMSALILLCVFGAGDAYGIPFSVIYSVGTIIILAREFIVTGFRMIAAGKNIVLAADKLGKLKTNFQMFAVILLLPCTFVTQLSVELGIVFLALGLTCFVFAVILTIMSAVNYIVKNPEVLSPKTAEKDEEFVEDEADSIKYDDIIKDVARFIYSEGDISLNKIQRKFCIGFARAWKIVNQLATLGLAEIDENTESKKSLITPEKFVEVFGEEI